jgi:3-hydroxyisobutyrate dehydrogenase-like beta-hydroxyacid dehydrogenase
MGMPICARLVERGFSVRATDARHGLRDELLGTRAAWTATVGAAAAGADVLITMLPGPDAVFDVAGDLLSALAPEAIWMDMSTGSPQLAEDLLASAVPKRVRLVDAPVAGGPSEARVGRLLAFAGGAPADLDEVQAVLNALADRVVHAGPSGSGYLVKLLTNLLWFGQAVANAEVLTLARRAGLDLDVLRDAVAQSAAANRFMAVDADALLDGDDLASFSLSGCCQQLSTVMRLGERLDVPLELAAVVSAVHRRALARYGDVDGELLAARLVAEQAGVELLRRPR